MKQKRKNSWFR